MKFIFHDKIEENDDVISLRFKPESPLRYEAGQFSELQIPHQNTDERGIKRWFTLSSSPTEELVSITTRNFGSQASSFKKALFSLQAGDKVQAAEAMGDFVLPKDASRPLLFVAGGIGITPMRSMAKYLRDTKQTRNITLLYAVRAEKDLLFIDLFKSIKAKVVPVVSSTSNSSRLSAKLILDYRLDNDLIFISGPEPMTEQLVEDLNVQGASEQDLVTDYFPGYENEYVTANA